VRDGRIDLSPMLTHRFPLDEWREAFTTIARQHHTGAIKVAFDFR
jgi:threonine dehydrogenase-like Zn-dependent dehydrogenase